MFKNIETERLILRKLKEGDKYSLFHQYCTDERVTKYLTWEPHQNIEVTRSLLNNWIKEYDNEKTYRWGITIKGNDDVVGMIDVVSYSKDGQPVIGYCLAYEHWNKGYMSEAFKAVIEFLYDEGFSSIRIAAANDNIGSNRVIIKNGFTLFKQEEQIIKPNQPKLLINIYKKDKAQ